MKNPFRAHPMTPEFTAAWRRYERANAIAADMYEAFPIAYENKVRLRRCACGTYAVDQRCRWCKKEKP